MLDSNVAANIRAIFIHNGESVSVDRAATLLGWDISSMHEAIKWRVMLLDESSPSAPLISRHELLEQAFEQWPIAAIAEALGPEDADRVLGEKAPNYGHLVVRDRGTAHAAVLRTLGASDAPALLRPHKRQSVLRRLSKAVAAARSLVHPKRRRARRSDGVRVYMLTPHGLSTDNVVPMFRMRGRWLARLGFKPGMRVYVAAEPGKLVMTVADPSNARVEVIPTPRLQLAGGES